MTAKITWNGPEAKAAARRATGRGLANAAEVVLAASREVVPIEEATLSRSGASSVDEAEMVAAVSYDTPYAVIQHERTDFRHDAGRTAKYLEAPLLATRAQQQAAIAQALQGGLG
ncbi:hypothetical protein [Litorihabitans aurantiacus]|uniref:HK97 gp10 family phage protein n=1 Tax=Litorihabitans aurantiacus TaxID=1930061 RepID=A0AA38CR08_9MICO|nr:hypothetical protein [Litorihabitans aurantiacus]GMA31601.1 hypothetical protein GCM10025875_15930 [Litorihabitans aurantiacus]